MIDMPDTRLDVLRTLDGEEYAATDLIVVVGLSLNPFGMCDAGNSALFASFSLAELTQYGKDGILVPFDSVPRDLPQFTSRPRLAGDSFLYLMWKGTPIVSVYVSKFWLKITALSPEEKSESTSPPVCTEKTVLLSMSYDAPSLSFEVYHAKAAVEVAETVDVGAEARQDIRVLHTALRGLVGYMEAEENPEEPVLNSVPEYASAQRIINKIKVKHGL